MHLELQTITDVVKGILNPMEAARLKVSGVEIDTRKIKENDLFVAICGERVDGHDYVSTLKSSVTGAMVERHLENDISHPTILVPNTIEALIRLANFWRRSQSCFTVAVTGSNGKTTVKEMLRHIGWQKWTNKGVHANEGNYNNRLGVALTLLKLQDKHCFLIAEAGMNHAGELTELGELIQPHVVVINNIQVAHIGNFASLSDVALAKGELLSGLGTEGVAVLNADDLHFNLLKEMAFPKKVLSFGFSKTATICGEMTSQGVRVQGREIRLQVPGVHNVYNAMAAMAAAQVAGVTEDKIIQGLESFKGVEGRLKGYPISERIGLIDDSYNANPGSTAAALFVLQEQAKRQQAKPLFVMGDMLDLGDEARVAHENVVLNCEKMKIELMAYGENMRAAIARHSFVSAIGFTQQSDLIEYLQQKLKRGRWCVLVKGSRGMKMENIVNQLNQAEEEK